ncbi:uncharacterized protein RCO7_06967 [Rhynchosporium graminicola]|uniref:Phospholipase/carboxylesterase/thioesterase domain-containing protein n=1 Tax=Rhynchosporium graminicola TaxID=2792576 RepID=A0A1E1K0Z9_9HELO|nr:uncharacterized protein RCO7_06967 [Rhynchosporium commune]
MENTAHIIPPRGDHIMTIILLHGRDSTATEFAEEFFEEETSDKRTLLEVFPTTKWVFPSSKIRDSARRIAAGFEDKSMSQWFDMYSTEDPSENTDIQIDGLRGSVSEILDLVRSEATLISSDRVFLGGISQGCATAIYALLFGGIRLGGFIGFSSWLPFEQEITTKMNESGGWSIDEYRMYYNHKILNSSAESTLITSNGEKTNVLKTPVFLSHSADDDVVSITNRERLSATLERLGMVVSWKRYEDGGHWIHEIQGVSDIVSFIHSCTRDKREN